MNDTTFITAIIDSLTESTDAVQALAKKAEQLNEDMKSGKYSEQEKQKLYTKQMEARQEIDRAKRAGTEAACAIVEAYKAELQKEDTLDPAELTDDVKLLSIGVPLIKRDIDALLERNKDNRTMVQIILRYAKEHGIDVAAQYVGAFNHAQRVDECKSVISLYEKWMDKPGAYDMLGKFFNQ